MAAKIAPPLFAKSMSSDIAFVKFLMGSQHKALNDEQLSMYARIYKVVFVLFLISFAVVGKVIIKG